MTTRKLQLTLLAAALTFGAQRPTPPTPRALLERGALAEEHQRDFAGAEQLYEQAEAAAKAAGDSKTAAEAAAARQRVLARQGKAAPGQEERDAAVREQLRQRALEILGGSRESGSSDADLAPLAQALADLGPSVVDVLTEALLGAPPERRALSAPHLPRISAGALARMENELADRALVTAFESADPTVRKAVVQAARGPRFIELQIRAAEDSVASIRGLASSHLLATSEPRAAPYVEARARTGDDNAFAWLARYAEARCVAIAEDAELGAELRAESLQKLVTYGAPTPQLLPRLLAIARDSSDSEAELRRAVWQAVWDVELPPVSERAAQVASFEPALLAIQRKGDDLSAVATLVKWQSSKSLDALRAAVERRPSGAGAEEVTSLAQYAVWLVASDLARPPFDALASLAVSAPRDWAPVVVGGTQLTFTQHLLAGLARNSSNVPLAHWTAFWPRVPAHYQHNYAESFAERLQQLMKDDARPELPGDAAPLLRYMLAGRSRDAGEAAVQVVTRLELVELIDDVVAMPLESWNSGLGGVVAQLHEIDSAKTLAAVRRRLTQTVKAQPFGRAEQRALEMLRGLPTVEMLQLWKELWPLASAPARELVLERLVRWQDKPQAAPLLVELYSDIERVAPRLREPTLRVFGAALTEAALPILEREIRNPDGEVRSAAMDVAEQFRKHREAVAEFEAWRKAVTVEQGTIADLAKLLESDNRDVLIGAVRALGILGARPALPALVKLLERKDPELQTAVRAAIDAIGAN
jgi:HEAT repeat protein